VIRKALGDAVKWNLIPRNVAEFSTPPKLMDSGRKELRTWTADQARSFLDGVTDDRLYAAWLLAVSTGMRRGEILGLRWEDVDLDALRLSVRQTCITVDYRIEFSTPKTKRSRRSIALDRGMVSALRAHRKRQMEERLAIGYLYSDSGLVFTKVDGKPLHPDYFSQAFDRLVRRSRLPRIRVHDLRHTYATLALAAGIHPKVVSERLGHSTVAFTMDVYSHAVPGMEADAAEKIAALIFGPTRQR
jgi:integrase